MTAGDVVIPSVESLAAGSSEGELLARCRSGDPEAFARLVALHEGMVFNLSLRMLGNPDEARDVSQDVFLQVYRTLARFEQRSSLRTWIYRIVVNQCRNRRRFWHRRRFDKCVGLDDLSPADEVRVTRAGAQESPFERVDRSERAARVQRALLALSFDHRAILVLREVEGLSCEEISRSLGIAEGTVKSRLSRARECLRRQLVPEPLAEGGAR